MNKSDFKISSFGPGWYVAYKNDKQYLLTTGELVEWVYKDHNQHTYFGTKEAAETALRKFLTKKNILWKSVHVLYVDLNKAYIICNTPKFDMDSLCLHFDGEWRPFAVNDDGVFTGVYNSAYNAEKVIAKYKPKLVFDDLEPGEHFKISGDDIVYIKTRESPSCNAIDPKKGDLYKFLSNHEVTKES